MTEFSSLQYEMNRMGFEIMRISELLTQGTPIQQPNGDGAAEERSGQLQRCEKKCYNLKRINAGDHGQFRQGGKGHGKESSEE